MHLACWMAAALLFFNEAWAFAKGENEIGTTLSYSDSQYDTDDGKVKGTSFSLGALYLHDFKSFWSGGELSYDTTRTDAGGDTSRMILGVPLKYWMKGPESKGVGFYVFSTPYLGREDDGTGGGMVLGLKMGPGIVVFLSDMVGIDTKLYYDYHRTGSRVATTTGMLVGFSIYF